MSLKARNIGVQLANRSILDDVSLSSEPGGLIGLIGPNGAGKSTLLRILAGLLQPSSGQLKLDGTDMSEIPAPSRARKLAYMPQEHIVSWPISVYDLVAMGRLPFQHPLAPLNNASRSAIANALAAMSVEPLAPRSAMELSGGELARVLLARALAQTPRYLLADEPTSGLDPAHKLQLLNHMAKVSDNGMSIIMVLHDLSLAARFCKHIVLLNKGRVYRAGRPTDVLTQKSLRDVYNIHAHIDEIGDIPVITPLDVEPSVF